MECCPSHKWNDILCTTVDWNTTKPVKGVDVVEYEGEERTLLCILAQCKASRQTSNENEEPESTGCDTTMDEDEEDVQSHMEDEDETMTLSSQASESTETGGRS
ncbi:hypothetical protein OS493_023500 [Desmophyllum pertusum]|uniref:Uncharacterized protein n=1 Tax=Desmophyllum pertusum TaxID=174260 RepID=A0A9W9ZMC2_9CNID|nr:hypothetical protein OS493_023500 [Desmophyllum pertusum]